jgi:hypothetical protein
MTEEEWEACDDAQKLLNSLATRDTRRCRLFFCACCRRISPLLTPLALQAVEVSERFADADATRDELLGVQPKAPGWSRGFGLNMDAGTAVALTVELPEGYDHLRRAAQWVAAATHDVPAEWRAQGDLFRDIFGNPFRSVTFDPEWRTSTAVALARQMYESRDFGAMPILADALQDAGCDTDDILSHCRGPGPHVRGCWVVDLVLGKE